jgi:hypothetical protein
MPDNPLALIAANWMVVVAVLAVAALFLSASMRRGASAMLRLLSHPLLLLAAVALIYDGTRTLAGGSGFIMTSLIEHWQTIAPASLESTKAFVTRRLGSALWDPAVMSALRLPAWLVLGGLGLLFSYIGRKTRAVNVFAN